MSFSKIIPQSNVGNRGFAWFDFDGTLCAPVFQGEGKTVVGYPGKRWIEFCNQEGSEAYRYCVPVESVIQYARRLHEAGFRLGVLTVACSEGEKIAKRAWLERTGHDELFEKVVFADTLSQKAPIMLRHAENNGFRPNQIFIVEDNYDVVLSVLSAGMVGIHISHILTGTAGIPV